MTPIQLLSATAYQLKKPYQQLLIPITIWIGMEQAFIGADFTQAFVSCALGIPSVGYVMISFGVVNAICCLLFGSVMKYIGRAPIMALGAVVHTALQVWLLLWRPHPSSPILFFIAAGLWGVGDAVWQTQVNGECREELDSKKARILNVLDDLLLVHALHPLLECDVSSVGLAKTEPPAAQPAVTGSLFGSGRSRSSRDFVAGLLTKQQNVDERGSLLEIVSSGISEPVALARSAFASTHVSAATAVQMTFLEGRWTILRSSCVTNNDGRS
jgi:MFS family permease